MIIVMRVIFVIIVVAVVVILVMCEWFSHVHIFVAGWRPLTIELVYMLCNAVFICALEPGFYEDGKFGIRIENLVLVVEANTPVCRPAAVWLVTTVTLYFFCYLKIALTWFVSFCLLNCVIYSITQFVCDSTSFVVLVFNFVASFRRQTVFNIWAIDACASANEVDRKRFADCRRGLPVILFCKMHISSMKNILDKKW